MFPHKFKLSRKCSVKASYANAKDWEKYTYSSKRIPSTLVALLMLLTTEQNTNK